MTVFIFIIVLAVLVLVHELGHFIVAKLSGIRVDEFALGFPPRLFGKKIGETRYSLNLVPFGGYVKIFGENADASNNASDESAPMSDIGERERSFQFKPKWIKALVLIGGVLGNMVFAWLCISLGFMIGMPSPAGVFSKEVLNPELTVVEVLVKSPAESAGIKSGDRILSISYQDKKETLFGENLTPESFQNFIRTGGEREVVVVYKHGQTENEVVLVPASGIVPDKKVVGLGTELIGTLKLSIPAAIFAGFKTTLNLTSQTVAGLLSFFRDALFLSSDFSQVTGPVGIAGVVGEANAMGFIHLLSLVAVISVNLAVINLLPFPALDGGRLFFLGIEALIGRGLPPRFIQKVNVLGFVILVLLLVIVTKNDIARLF